MNEDWTLLENFTKTSWFLLPCFCVHRHFSISKGGSFPKPVIYPPTYLNWIFFDSIYLSNLFKPSSCEGLGLGHSEVSVGRRFFPAVKYNPGSKYIPRYQGGVLNDRGDISSPLPNLNWISLLLMVRRSLATTPLRITLTISTLELSHHPSS